MSKFTWNHEEIWNNANILREAVHNSKSMRQVLTSLGIEPSSNRYQKLKEQCALYGIQLIFENPKASLRRTPDDEVFANPSIYGRGHAKELRKRAIELGYVQSFCEECGNAGIWNDKPLTLQIDHIDGNHKNNLPENLRSLCPNCHSQTETYGSKNIKKLTCKNNHPWIEENLWGRSGRRVCKLCARKYNRQARWKEKESQGWIVVSNEREDSK